MDSEGLKSIFEKLRRLNYVEGSEDLEHHTQAILEIQKEELNELKKKLAEFKRDNFKSHDAYVVFANKVLLSPPFSRFFGS